MATNQSELRRRVYYTHALDLVYPWRVRYRAWRLARWDKADAQRITKERAKRVKLSERLEARLRSNLSRELRKMERLVVDRLTRLGFHHTKTRSKSKKELTKIRFAQTAASPTEFFLRVDTVKMPWGRQNHILELQEPYVLYSLAAAVKKPVSVWYQPAHGFWYVIERAPKPETQEYIDVLLQMPKRPHVTALPLGIDVNYKLAKATIASMPHLLIAGTTGYGKSVYLHCLACTLIQQATPQQLRLTFIDLAGGVEFGVYRKVPHLYGRLTAPTTGTALARVIDAVAPSPTPVMAVDVADDTEAGFKIEPKIYIEPEDVPRVLKQIQLEVRRRMALFIEKGVRNIDGWNLKQRFRRHLRLPYWVIIIDEIQNVMLDKKLRVDVEPLLARIASTSRKVGIHLVIATQRPSVDVVTGLIKANFPARVAFNMASMHDSMTVLGNGDAASLGRPGLLIYQHGTRKVTAQAPFLSEALVSDIIERVVEGKPSITELTHSVGKLDMVEWAIDANEGVFSIDDVYFAFKARGVTHRDVRECSLAFIGQVIEVNGKFYKLKRQTDGRNCFEEVADA